MDMNLFRKFLAKTQNTDVSEGVTLPPEKSSGVVRIKDGTEVELKSGDIINIKRVIGKDLKRVRVLRIVDVNSGVHGALGGKVTVKDGSAELGMSANGIASIEKVNADKKITAVLLASGKVVKEIPCKSTEEAHKHVSTWLDSGSAKDKRSASINVDVA